MEELTEDPKMYARSFEPTKSTKGASKMRRDLINAEISNLRDLLPLPPATRQRLSQLQLMALICVYVRKTNYFQQALKGQDLSYQRQQQQLASMNIGFSKALNGFLMMITQNGKLLYISDNAAEYLGHSMEDLLIHGDSVYDIIDRQDQQTVQGQLTRSTCTASGEEDLEERMFLCRMNVSRNARRQMRFGDQKVVLVRGHFVSYLPLCSRNEPVFLAVCTPLAMPETRECVAHGATNVFTTIHTMDMKISHIDKNGEWYLGWEKSELQEVSWYQLIHWEFMREAQSKHRLITQSEQEKSCILLLKLQKRCGEWIWVHAVLQLKENMENSQHPIIVCTNQVLSESEATIMQANSWLYDFYSVQSKFQYGLTYGNQNQNYFNQPGYTESPYQDYAGEDVSSSLGLNGMEAQGYYMQPEPPGGTVLRHTGGIVGPDGQPYETYERLSLTDGGPVDYSTHSSPVSPENDERYHHHESSKIYPESRSPTRTSAKRKYQASTKSACLPPSVQPIVLDNGETIYLSHQNLDRPRSQYKDAEYHSLDDPANCIDRWNPSPPWSDSAIHKAQTYQDVTYHPTTPLTPSNISGYPVTYNSSNTCFDFEQQEFYPESCPQQLIYTNLGGTKNIENFEDQRRKPNGIISKTCKFDRTPNDNSIANNFNESRV